jgi:hypothetical protein
LVRFKRWAARRRVQLKSAAPWRKRSKRSVQKIAVPIPISAETAILALSLLKPA